MSGEKKAPKAHGKEDFLKLSKKKIGSFEINSDLWKFPNEKKNRKEKAWWI